MESLEIGTVQTVVSGLKLQCLLVQHIDLGPVSFAKGQHLGGVNREQSCFPRN